MTNHKLKLHLIKNNIKENCCENCRLTQWLGNQISLELHHIDGNNQNNDISNIKLLCPNCHSLTHNYRGKNKKSHPKKIVPDSVFIEIIPQCYSAREALIRVGLVGAGANYTRIKKIMMENNLSYRKKEVSDEMKKASEKRLATIMEKYGSIKTAVQPKIDWPSKEELEKELAKKSVSKVGRELKVSDNAVRKRAKKYGIDIFAINPWSKKHGGHSRTRTDTDNLTSKSF